MALAGGMVATLFAPLNTDSGWYLVGARRLLEGDRLYVDIIDVNPPLIFWLNTPVALVGQHLRVADDRLVAGAVAVALLAAMLLGQRVLSLAPVPSRISRSGVLCGFLITIVLLSPYDVGQRDQLAAIMFFPYSLLAARAARQHGTPVWLSLVCGIFAGVGTALKPYFLAPWIAVELTVVMLRRDLRSCLRLDVAVFLLTQSLFVVALLIVAPGYLATVVPLARETYGAYGVSWRVVLTAKPVLFLLSCGLGAIAVYGLLPPRHHALAPVFGAASLGFLASFVGQVAFSYQLIPAQAFAAVALVATVSSVVLGLADCRSKSWWRRLVLFAVAAALLWVGARIVPMIRGLSRNLGLAVTSPYPQAVSVMADTVREVAAGEPVYFLSTSVWPAFPVVNLAGAKWPYRYNCLWPIPSWYGELSSTSYRQPDDQSGLERVFFETVVADLVRTPPRLLVVERGVAMQGMRGHDFDFVKYFSASPEFAALFRRYRRLGRIAAWEFFELP